MMSNVFGHADDNRDGNSEDDAFNSSVGERSSSGVHETEQNDVSERTERAHLPDIASVQLDLYPESTQPMSSRWAPCTCGRSDHEDVVATLLKTVI